jgi:phosphoacetylglucosamine mutase
MVTASHNPEEDNGVKLVDPEGEMLSQHWEAYATQLANCEHHEQLPQVLQQIAEKEGIALDTQANVITGRDTRPSSVTLMNAVHDGIRALGGHVQDMGEVTTPQLHFAVRQTNRQLPADEQAYYQHFTTAFKNALLGLESAGGIEPLIIDGSNGVGAPKAQIFAQMLQQSNLHHWEVRNLNGKLNYLV